MNEIDKIKNPFFSYFTSEKYYEIIEKYTSPVFIYCKKVIEDQYKLLYENLPQQFNIFYAQKSNPHPEILKLLNSLGAGCDTASKGEVLSAFKAGFSEDKIMLTGPGKTKEELELAVDKNLHSVNIESLQEAILLNQICLKKNKVQNVLIRINPVFEAGETNRIIGGMGVSKFGIDMEQIPDVIEAIKNLSSIKIKGIHIFNSSQILDASRILESTKNVIDTAMILKDKFEIDVEHIDLGGGFGIPYSDNESLLNVKKLGDELNALISKSPYENFLKNVKLIYEPGRFLSGQCGIYLTKVLYTKKSSGKNIAVVDGGIHHMLRPALIGQGHLIKNLTGIYENRTTKEEYLVAGPLCTSLDELSKNELLHQVKQGDFLAVLNAGAYGFTESMPYFLTQSPAIELFVD